MNLQIRNYQGDNLQKLTKKLKNFRTTDII
nr:MAG TPA: hypothetical protein [Bacteriophage sp.]